MILFRRKLAVRPGATGVRAKRAAPNGGDDKRGAIRLKVAFLSNADPDPRQIGAYPDCPGVPENGPHLAHRHVVAGVGAVFVALVRQGGDARGEACRAGLAGTARREAGSAWGSRLGARIFSHRPTPKTEPKDHGRLVSQVALQGIRVSVLFASGSFPGSGRKLARCAELGLLRIAGRSGRRAARWAVAAFGFCPNG
jgi:hypothetical protein